MSRGIFVTATDTEVGKTVVTAGLHLLLEQRGYRVGLLKPAQSGRLRNDPESDVMRLLRLTGSRQSADEAVCYDFAPPVAPGVAARLAGTPIERDVILQKVRDLSSRYDVVLVEGAGGLMTPFGEDWTCADLAAAIGFPLLIVARPTLGTVNHTVLTAMAARRFGLTVAGVLMSESAAPKAKEDPSVGENPRLIERFGQVKVLGALPWLGTAWKADELAAAMREHTRTEPILDCLQDAR